VQKREVFGQHNYAEGGQKSVVVRVTVLTFVLLKLI